MNEASGYASDLADQAKQATSSYASSAADYTRKTTEALRDQSSRMMDQGTSMLESTMDRILRDQPLVVALSGLAIGAAAAAAFAPTEMEKRTIGPVVEQAANQLKQATESAGNKLKEVAGERGLNAEGLKEVAAEVGEAFTSGLGGGPDRQGSGPPETKPQPR
jgi:gas vesicle protein